MIAPMSNAVKQNINQILILLNKCGNNGAKKTPSELQTQRRKRGRKQTPERELEIALAGNCNGQNLASFCALTALNLLRNITMKIIRFGGQFYLYVELAMESAIK